MKHHALAAAALALSSLTFTSLPVHAQAAPTASASASAVDHKAVAQHYSALVYANYSDTLAAAKDMQAAIAEFVKAPSAEGMDKARKAWLAAREFYGQTEAFRFYGGPIDNDNGPEGQINAWPLDEAYVDYVEASPTPASSTTPSSRSPKPT